MSRIITPTRRIVKPTPGEVWLAGNPHPLAKELVGAWLFNDRGGSRVFDYARANHGALQGMDPATDWIPGMNGGALDFDGTDDWVNVPHRPSFDVGQEMTLAVWFRMPTWRSSDFLVGVVPAFAQQSHQIGTGFSGNGISFTRESGNTGFSADLIDSSLFDGSWNLVAGVSVGGDVKIYGGKNGKLGFAAGGHSQTWDTGGTNPITIGQWAGGNYFLGQIGAVLLYNRALGDHEIRELSSNPGFNWARRPRPRWTGFDAAAAGGAIEASGSITLTGTAAITGDGAVEASASIVLTGTASITGKGQIEASEGVVVTGTATVSSSSSIEASGSIVLTGTSEITGKGAVEASGSIVLTGTATLSGSGAIEASESIVLTGTASLDAGAIIASGDIVITGTAEITAKGAIEASEGVVLAGTATLTAGGDIEASGAIVITGTAVIADSSGLSRAVASGSFSLTGTAEICGMKTYTGCVTSDFSYDSQSASAGSSCTTGYEGCKSTDYGYQTTT